jgi:hypothetical protein
MIGIPCAVLSKSDQQGWRSKDNQKADVANQENNVDIASIVSRMALPRGIEPLFQP